MSMFNVLNLVLFETGKSKLLFSLCKLLVVAVLWMNKNSCGVVKLCETFLFLWSGVCLCGGWRWRWEKKNTKQETSGWDTYIWWDKLTQGHQPLSGGDEEKDCVKLGSSLRQNSCSLTFWCSKTGIGLSSFWILLGFVHSECCVSFGPRPSVHVQYKAEKIVPWTNVLSMSCSKQTGSVLLWKPDNKQVKKETISLKFTVCEQLVHLTGLSSAACDHHVGATLSICISCLMFVSLLFIPTSLYFNKAKKYCLNI